jgi:hypothetical protein
VSLSELLLPLSRLSKAASFSLATLAVIEIPDDDDNDDDDDDDDAYYEFITVII